MEEPTTMMNRKSWESLSSSFSNLDVSFSQDSWYASDEISVVSSNPTTVDTSVAPSQDVSPELSLGPSLKSILKKPEAIPEENMESGYRTDASDYEFETMSNEDDDEEQNNKDDDDHEGEEEEDDDDEEEEEEEDLCDVSLWGDASDISEIGNDGEVDFADDGSFIAFESMVRFAPNVEYIEAPETEDDEEEETSTGLTCHEIMELARSSGSVQFLGDDEATAMKPGVCGCIPMMDDPEEHTGDMVDLDRQLFVAYVNGIKEIADSQYKTRLRALVDDIRLGQAETPYLENNDTDGVFFDHALNHVLGVFRNLMLPEEWAELISLSAQKHALAPQSRAMANHNSGLMERIQRLLVERLAQGNVDVEPDELRFFAGGIIYALENWQGLLES